MRVSRLVGAAGAACLAGSASAGTVNLFQSAGNTYQAPALTGFQTHGDNMAGMVVTARFADGSSQSLAWATFGVSSGGVIGAGWSLSETTDTFNAPWKLTNNRGVGMTSITLNGAPGNTLFDRFWGAGGLDEGTLGSARGADYSEFAGGIAGLVTNVTYRNQFQRTGFTPVGDLFETLEIAFANAGGLASGLGFEFRQDTDNGAGGPVILIPLPAGVWAAAPVLVGLGVIRRLRRN